MSKGYKRRPFSFIWNVNYTHIRGKNRLRASSHRYKVDAEAYAIRCEKKYPWMTRINVTKRMVREGW